MATVWPGQEWFVQVGAQSGLWHFRQSREPANATFGSIKA